MLFAKKWYAKYGEKMKSFIGNVNAQTKNHATSIADSLCVSIDEIPSISANISRKYTSGSNSFSSQALNFSASRDVITLNSKQLPQTTRSTDLTPSTALRSSRTDSSATCAETKLALPPTSSSSHLQRHSRAIVSNSTPSAICLCCCARRNDFFLSPSRIRSKGGGLGFGWLNAFRRTIVSEKFQELS